MSTNEKKNFFLHNLDIFILIAVTAVGLAVSTFHLFQNLEYRFYDTMLNSSSEIGTNSNIVLIDIEDQSINEIGSWPWSRDILADVLIRMKELGAYNAVFDIEYLSPSNLAVSDTIEEITENAFSVGEMSIATSLSNFASSVANRSIPLNRVTQESNRLLSDSIDPVLFDMFRQITDGLYRDNDLYFGQAVQFFGNASLTVNTRDLGGLEIAKDEVEYAEQRFLFDKVVDIDKLIDKTNNAALREGEKRAFVLPISKILQHASGAGFTNVVIDADGTRRRVELLSYQNGKYIGQLSFAPLARMMDVQFMERKKQSLVLYGVKLPGQPTPRNLEIPLDLDGRMIINWLHSSYHESFRHVPVYSFYILDLEEKQIVDDLSALYNATVSGADDWLAEVFDGEIRPYIQDLLQTYASLRTLKSYMLDKCRGYDMEGKAIDGGLTDEDYETYFTARNAFFDETLAFSEELIEAFGADTMEIALLNESSTIYKEDFAAMRDALQDAFCIIGNSATGSTDLGATPFERRYANMGTHANVINTILQEDFIREVDPIWAIEVIFVLAFINILFSRRFSPALRNVHGFVYLILPIVGIVMLFLLWRIYIPIMGPIITVGLTYIGELTLNFITANVERNTLRRGFDAYVAPEVVSQIVKNPGMLQLGGMNKRMTALFSDVQKFSAFTEQINKAEGEGHGAVRLVEILNGYLGVLSDAIMECRGTIDKYVGDEIVAFFGAPIDNPNNAFDSCVAGIRMKQAEDRYNEEHLEELPLHPVTGEPFLLKSRVGCNTGDMVVGNMGTEKKLNYTIMGNNVNLASRLEGTNKEYDSWIIASESTWLEANKGENEGKIIARQLDCVKVINVEKPVQIYSIVGLRDELTAEEIEAAEIFNQGMEWYLRGRTSPATPKDLNDFKQAISYFERAYKCLEARRAAVKDFISPEKKMALRCQNYLKNGLPLGKDGKPLPWDGVFTMATK